MQKAIAIVPARYASSRFPGKPLVEINGKSMIMRVYEQAIKAGSLKDVYVATDDERIFSHVTENGGKVLMTSAHHSSGTERCLEAFETLKNLGKCMSSEVIVNIQGDGPFIKPEQINALVALFSNPEVKIASLMKKISNPEEHTDPNCVKVVTGKHKQALYFSRASLPYIRDENAGNLKSSHTIYKHIGMYAYRSAVLQEICRFEPTPLEQAEKLEQLRWLGHGFTIHMEITEHESIAIDTPADLLKVTNIT